jgi:L-ascorbate metabolism protein UlaG (beta-lactamase superfamily)
MQVRWLGWAGVEIENEGEAIVIDPLRDPGATFAGIPEASERATLPSVVAPSKAGRAVAGLVTHLHRDHTDARALAEALADGAPVLEPPRFDGEPIENLALAQADAELDQRALPRDSVEMWGHRQVGGFSITALPAVDGLGDPQVSWLAEAGGLRVLHLGDTIFHSYWWRIARRHGPFDLVLAPINGAVVTFPHLRPPSPYPAAMEPEQAALAGELLGARLVVPIHYDGYSVAEIYEPVANSRERFLAAAAGRGYDAGVLEVGEQLELASSA